jgi:hypothetical protein
MSAPPAHVFRQAHRQCRLKQAGCEFPNPRAGPKRADTAESISAREYDGRNGGLVRKMWLPLCALPRQSHGGLDQHIVPICRDLSGTIRPQRPDQV